MDFSKLRNFCIEIYLGLYITKFNQNVDKSKKQQSNRLNFKILFIFEPSHYLY